MFVELPDELQKAIAAYLDAQSLCFFACTSHRSLRNAQASLIKHQPTLLRPPTLFLIEQGLALLYYTANAAYVCGENSYGQLGLGHTDYCTTLTPLDKLPTGKILQVVAGDSHTLVHTDQGLYVCGLNEDGQLGLGHTKECTILTPLDKLPPGKILQIVVGVYHTLVHTDQGLYACGYNKYGQLGLGHTNLCTTLTLLDKQPPGKILQIAAGCYYTIVHTDQGLYGCGHNEYGQLGLGHTKDCTTLTPLDKLPPRKILQVVAGGDHTLIHTDQGLYVCGSNEDGQLGLGHTNKCKTLTPLDKLPPGKILQVVAGDSHTLVHTDQGLYACGFNYRGQLGLGHTKKCTTLTPLDKLPPGKILLIAAVFHHTLVQTDQGLYVCGNNANGQLGLGHTKQCTVLTLKNLPFELRQLHALYHQVGKLITLSESKDMVSQSIESQNASHYFSLK